MKSRILTGDTPTGRYHIGHYVGTLENRIAMQDDYEMFIVIADMHALTTLKDRPKEIRQHTINIVRDQISAGLDPEKVTFFAESEVPEIYELATLFSMYVSHNRALRNPTIKDEIKMKGLGDKFSLGFVNYPILQAADILCVKGELVPVGEDQKAHLEQTRELARDINKIAGEEIFPIPEAKIGRVGKLIGTDGNPKMGKSLGNTIYLSATPEEVQKSIMGMYTDPKRIRVTDPGKVEGNPLFVYLDSFSTEQDAEAIKDFKKRYKVGEVGDVEVKKYLVGVMERFLAPMRERSKQYTDTDIINILQEGSRRTRVEAVKTLSQVKEALDFSIYN